MKMKTIKVVSASSMQIIGMLNHFKDTKHFSTMGDLVDLGILTKEYRSTGRPDEHDIVWTNISEDVIVKGDCETIMPGESVTWEK